MTRARRAPRAGRRAGRVGVVVVVGNGRMGAAITRALREAGVAHETMGGRRIAGASTRRGATKQVARMGAPACWVLAVTDGAIETTCAALVGRGLVARGDAVVHLAGMLGPEALRAARAVGAVVGALHPLVAVASRRAPPSLAGCAASFEGDAAARRLVRAWADRVGLGVYALAGVERARYHGAAALVASGGVALAQGAAALFRGAAARGASERAVRAFASSLLASVAHNVRVAGPEGALASPLMRGDTATVQRHLDAMRPEPAARAVYAAVLAQVVATLEARGAVPPDVLARARALLARERAGAARRPAQRRAASSSRSRRAP